MSPLNEDVVLGEVTYVLNDGPASHTTKHETKIPVLHKCYLLFISIVISSLTAAVPFLIDAANAFQSQNLYIGMMLTKGEFPYSNIFTTQGLLYFGLIALSYHLGTTLWLVLVHIFCYYLSGVYLYKLVNYFTKEQTVALAMATLYYILSAILGMGGLYAMQFATPFVLISTWFLTKYFAGVVQDEAFVLFGFLGAFSMLLEPKALVFWVLACVTISIYNIVKKHIARGFYQLLGTIFGMNLVFYTAGYFILSAQILNPYLTQAVAYPFKHLMIGQFSGLTQMILPLLLAIGFGLLTGLFDLAYQSRSDEDAVIKWFLFAVSFVYLATAILMPDFQLYHLLPLLPFTLVLLAIPLARHYEAGLANISHRRRRGKNGPRRVFFLYFSKHFYMPLLLMLLAVGWFVYDRTQVININQERFHIGAYFKKKLTKDQAIYVWDDSAKIYLESRAKSASQFPTPTLNVDTIEHQKLLEDELLENKAVYIIVNKKQTLPKSIKTILRTKYKPYHAIRTKGFTIYKQK